MADQAVAVAVAEEAMGATGMFRLMTIIFVVFWFCWCFYF